MRLELDVPKQLVFPARFELPAVLAGELSDAVAAGRADAAGWARIHPTGSERRYREDALRTVPTPPVGEAAAHDLARVHDAMARRTPDGDHAAQIHAAQTGWDTWGPALEQISREQGPAQAHRAHELVQQSLQRTDAVIGASKVQHARRRPYEIDDTVSVVVPMPHGNASYPSGHSSGAYAAAVVLSELLPSRRQELLDAAAQVAYSRVYGGVHFPSDVIEGARVAARVGYDVLRRGGVIAHETARRHSLVA